MYAVEIEAGDETPVLQTTDKALAKEIYLRLMPLSNLQAIRLVENSKTIEQYVKPGAGSAESVESFPSQPTIEVLKLLFWRHFPSNERAELLRAAKIIPGPPRTRLPQTMEAHFLDTASKKSLASLWAVMCTELPADVLKNYEPTKKN